MALPLVLASTSPYRRALLEKLEWSFRVEKPLFDEEPFKKDPRPPRELARFLAQQKAQSVKASSAEAVIGSDQLLALGSKIYGKAGSAAAAVQQLMELRGKKHELITAVAVRRGSKLFFWEEVAEISMGLYTETEARAVVELDQAWDCAGSYKFEGHGVRLMDHVQVEDAHSIQGLPLLKLQALLRHLEKGTSLPGGIQHVEL